MIGRTNFQMVRSYSHAPEHWGVLNKDEVNIIREHFKIKERSDTELQNLRDFVVMYYAQHSNKDYNIEMTDAMSAITGVIDSEKIKRGLEV